MKKRNVHSTVKRVAALVLSVIVILLVMPMNADAAVRSTNIWTGLAEGEVLIKDTVTAITDGVVEHEVITNTPNANKQCIDYISEVKLGDDIKIVAGYGKNDATKWSLTPTTKQAAAYEADHPGSTVVAGINADFFNMATGEPMGALVMEGHVYHSSNGRYYFGITKTGEPVIRNSADLSDLESAVGGDILLVNNGVPIDVNSSYGDLAYSRCAIGIKADGTVVTFVTHGLKAPISCGRNYVEMAQMFANVGCKYALALDGGGSATYCSRPEGSDKLVVANSPADGAERAVSSALLVVSTAEATGVFDHVAISPNNEVFTPESEVAFEAKAVDTAGKPMDMPQGLTWALSDDSAERGTIDAQTGVFKANNTTGVVTVQMLLGTSVVGETRIEVNTPDHIYFANEEISLGFEETTDFGLVVRNAGRDMHIKPGDIIWKMVNDEGYPEDKALGIFDGNSFTSSDGTSLKGTVTAISKWDQTVKGSIHTIVGMLPTLVWDFEDYTDPTTGEVIDAQDYYINDTNTNPNGILSHSNYNKGGKESIEIVGIDDGEPVRFGEKSLKLNYDFTNCGAVTEGACIGTTDMLTVPGVPTGIGVWVYAPEGVGIKKDWTNDKGDSGFWLRGYVRDGLGNNKPFDFTLEPKVFQNGVSPNPDLEYPGIYWEGWKYLEANLSEIAAPYSIQPGMTFRLMYVAGTGMGTKSAGSIYFDNLQFVYGTNVDDTDEPVIDSITLNDVELEDGAEFITDTFDVKGIFHDVENKYTTGIDKSTVRMYVDGVNVVDNDKYQYVLDPDGKINHLYGLKLEDGSHSIMISVRDGFGNETQEVRNFTVNTGNVAETTVTVIPQETEAIIGKTVSLDITAANGVVTENTTILRLGNLFPDYEVKFNENYEGTSSYNKTTGQLTIKETRKESAPAEADEVIAQVIVKVPNTLNSSAMFDYEVKGGNFVTSTGYYSTYSQKKQSLNVTAEYAISTDIIVVSEEAKPAVLTVTNSKGEPAPGVDVYLVSGDTLVGTTDETGKLETTQFSTEAGTYPVYAKDSEGLLSFIYNVFSYAAGEHADGVPYGIRFNVVSNVNTEKNISWFSNPLTSETQMIRYAVKGSDNWKTAEANTKQHTFVNGGNFSVLISNVVLDNLTPGTEYEYQVGIGAEDKWTEVDTFTTEPLDEESTNFFVIGDIQTDNMSNITAIKDKLAEGHYDFGVQTGDAVDNASNYMHWYEYSKIFNASEMGDTNMLQVLGNHEYEGDANAAAAEAYYNLRSGKKGAGYSAEYGDVYIATINYTATEKEIKDAMAWLEADAKASDAQWKILFMHQPPYYTNTVGGNELINLYVPEAAEKAGIDVVFSGHDHSLAATNPLRGGEIDEENGIVYFITGSCGEKAYSISSQGRFDYDKIFDLATLDFTATYLTAEVSKHELTINVCDLNVGPMRTITLQSDCMKKGHENIYDPEAGTIHCGVCGDPIENHTGEIKDKDGNEYYILTGEKQTGWVTIGEEVRYYALDTGIREAVTIDETPSTCIIDGHCIYTSASGVTKRIEYIDAGGHEYVEQTDGSFKCSKCEHTRIEMSDCTVELSYKDDVCVYTGKARTPSTKAIAPDGSVLTKAGQSTHPDYYSAYKNNVNVGTASVTLTARKYGTYVNLNDWRGNCKGSTTVTYEIRPDTPTGVKIAANGENAILSWEGSKAAESQGIEDFVYIIYESLSDTEWKEIATTKDTTFEINGAEYAGASFRVGSRATVGGKTYESIRPTNAVPMAPILQTGLRDTDGKPTLRWNAINGAVKYEVYRSLTEDGEYGKVFETKYVTYTHTSATVDRTYYYKVKAIFEDESETLFSTVVSQTCACAQPVVIAELDTDGKPELSWEKVAGAASYNVYRRIGDGELTKVATVENTTYVDVSAEVDTTYKYEISAVSKSGVEGKTGVSAEITTLQLKPVVTVNNEETTGRPVLSWTPIKQAASYKVHIYCEETADVPEKTVALDATDTTWMHDTAAIGTTYFYVVEVVFTEDTSNYSDKVSGVCEKVEFPVITGNRETDGKPNLAWTPLEGAVSYEVYRAGKEDGNYVKVYTTKGSSYTHISAETGRKYYYKVKVIYADGFAVYSDVVSNSYTAAEVEVNVRTGNNLEGKPILSWDKIEDAKGYQVLRATTEDGKYVRVFETTGTSYTHISAEEGNTYYYKVRVILNDGRRVHSDVVSNICESAAIHVSVETGHNVKGKPTLRWKGVDGIAKYQVYRATEEDGKYVRVFETTGTSYTHISAEVGESYYYKVKVVFADETYVYSDVVTNTCEEPTVEWNVETTNNAEGKPALRWETLEEAVKYQVYRTTEEDGKYARVFETTGTSYTHVSAEVGKSYYYKVKAVFADETYVYSDVVSDTCEEPTVEVTVETGNNADGKPTLRWETVEEAVKYQVYRTTEENGKYARVFETTGTSYTHVSAEAGNTYYYMVKVVFADETYVYSDVVVNSKVANS